MDIDLEIYGGKSFKDLCKDIVVNQSSRKEQIELFISDLRPMIKTINDAMQVVPLIKQYIDSGISNDEHLVKLAQICQRLMTAQANAESAGGTLGLTDEEKKDLMSTINEIGTQPITVTKISPPEKK